MNFIDKIKSYKKEGIYLLAYTLLFFIFMGTLKYTFPFVFGGFISFKLIKPTQWLINKGRIKPTVATLVVTIVFYAVLLIVVGGIGTLLIAEISSLIKNMNTDYFITIFSSFKLHSLNLYNGLSPEITEMISNNLQSLIKQISTFIVSGLQGLLKNITSIPYIIMTTVFSVISTYFSANELLKKSSWNLVGFDKPLQIAKQAKEMGGKYVGAYCSLILITFFETLIMFGIFKIKYAILLAIICAVFDMLPIIGIGSIFVPLTVYYFISGNSAVAIGLLICWGIAIIARQIIEPKLLSSSLDISPLLTLMAIYIGLNVGGVIGIFYFIFMIIGYKVCKKVNII